MLHFFIFSSLQIYSRTYGAALRIHCCTHSSEMLYTGSHDIMQYIQMTKQGLSTDHCFLSLDISLMSKNINTVLCSICGYLHASSSSLLAVSVILSFTCTTSIPNKLHSNHQWLEFEYTNKPCKQTCWRLQFNTNKGGRKIVFISNRTIYTYSFSSSNIKKLKQLQSKC